MKTVVKCLVSFAALLIAGGCATEGGRRDPTLAAEARAVKFLQQEVPAWSRDNGCFSCHNNGDAARALYAATRAGHRLPARALADTTAWVAQPQRWEHNKGDPGFSDQRLANLQFAATLVAAFEAGHVRDRLTLQIAAAKVAADQGADGAWHIERQNSLGSPATHGTTLATFIALTTLQKAAAPGTSGAIEKAERWLQSAKPENVPAAAALLLAASRSTARAWPQREECLALLRRAQTRDGGWGPFADTPPEPFDTALALLALAELGEVPGIDEMIQRGRKFLAAQQNPDGSWPATTRPPGGHSYAQCLSTTGWATLALLRTRP